MCGKGRQQSPIHIRTHRAKVDLTLTELNVSYNVLSSGYMINEAHALSVEVGDAGHLFLDGQDYTLLHFHFHSPSEHIIDGVHPPLEMHMVHESADGKTLAVIGIPFMVGSPSPFLDEFWIKYRLLEAASGVQADPSRTQQQAYTKAARKSGAITDGRQAIALDGT
ncbi:hypothetical protein R1sor_012039 [Riccia sorocarpa]|uniref:Alpha-carbonic anhydrase domain-containing protein n=1 Tax=Riccia sorocarpa TaxID=122646 RepID=A0ABD3I2N6_9MARC